VSRVRVHTDDPAIFTYTFEGPLDAEGFDQLLRDFERPLECGIPFAIIVVASPAVTMPLAQRQRLASWIQQHRALVERYVTGSAFVSPSPRLRFILSTIIVIEPMPIPYRVTATLAEARAWTRASLDGGALSGDPSTVALVRGHREVGGRAFPTHEAHPGVDKRREL
jgi:hypothetical protein